MSRNDQPPDQREPSASTHPVMDTAGLEKLEGSLNDLSKAAATQSLTYLLLWLYLIFTVTAVTDYDLLVEKPVKLPIFELEVGLLKFFIGAPALFWLVQLYMVRKVSVIADAVRHYLAFAEREAAKHATSPGAVLEALRHRVDGFVLTRLLTRFDTVRCADGVGPASPPLPQALTILAAAVTLVLAPLLLYGAFQGRFLAYQSEAITWWHRICLFAGLALSAAAAREAGLTWADTLRALRALLLGLFGGLVRSTGKAKRKDRGWLDWTSRRLAVMAGPVILAMSLTCATIPGEFLSDGVVIEGVTLGDWLSSAGIPRTLTPRPPHSILVATQPAGRDTPDKSLSGPPLLNLGHRDFTGRSLRKAVLSNANLTGAVFWGAKLHNADLSNAQLQGAVFREANLSGTDLSEANLNEAIFYKSILIKTNFKDAKLQKSVMHESIFTGSDLSGADIQEIDVYKSDFHDADFSLSKLNEAAFDESILNNVDLSNAVMKNTSIHDSQMDGSDLTAAKLEGAHIINSFLQMTLFAHANLSGADLSKSHFQGANFLHANLTGATLPNTVLHGASFYLADLTGADLSYSQLHGADFSRSYLQGANLKGAEIWRTLAYGAKIGNIYYKAPEKTQEEQNHGEFIENILKWIERTPAEKHIVQPDGSSRFAAYNDQRVAEFTDYEERSFGGKSLIEYLLAASNTTTPSERALYLTTLSCSEGDTHLLKAVIMRLSKSLYGDDDAKDLSPWQLSTNVADPQHCHAASGLSDDERDLLVDLIQE